jgi:predicted CopG family antitoxin
MTHTTIRVSEEVRERLKTIGKKGETYNDIIEKLVVGTPQKKEATKEKAKAGEKALTNECFICKEKKAGTFVYLCFDCINDVWQTKTEKLKYHKKQQQH